MSTAAVVILDIELEDPAREADLLAWWDQARRLLAERARLASSQLVTLAHGRYQAQLGFALPGVWKIVEKDHRWHALEATRPPARVTAQQGRVWRRDGNPRDLTTAELATWLDDRSAGRRDFVLADTLARTSWEEEHIPGAISLPLDQLDAGGAARAIGPDLDRPVIVYCGSYG